MTLFIIGLFVGACVGAVIIGLCAASKEDNDERKRNA